MEALYAVEAVEAVLKAKHRIDREQYPLSTTFFSVLDRWLYYAVSDTKVCPTCMFFENQQPAGGYSGDWLRGNFPYLEILDVDEIAANVHPNCRCVLKRIINLPEEKEPVGKKPHRIIGYDPDLPLIEVE